MPDHADAGPGRLTAESAGDQPAHARSGPASGRVGQTSLERQTGLGVTIKTLLPSALVSAEDLRLHGTVENKGGKRWKDAQVYLDIGFYPATSRSMLSEFAANTEGFGSQVVDFGLFDQIGTLKPGAKTTYTLKVPFDKLPISKQPGVYHVGVTVIASDLSGERAPVARTATFVPLLPPPPGKSSHAGSLQPTGIVTIIPLTAPIRQSTTGVFLDDDLATLIAKGGQLQNLLDFVAAAPPNTLQVVLDPALRQAVADMADGYLVRNLAEVDAGTAGHPGLGETAAQKWLTELDTALQRQSVMFMPWGSPDASALGSHRMTGVVAAAVRASQRYASEQRVTANVASWPYAGATTRRGISVAAAAGAPVRIVSQRSLVNDRGLGDGSYPPAQVLVPTALGHVTALVTRTDVAGAVITPDLSGPDLLRDIIAEATIRSLNPQPSATSVIAVPFGWDPGRQVGALALSRTYGFAAVEPETAETAGQEPAVPYRGPIKMPRIVAGLPDQLLSAIEELRNKGRILTDLLTNQEQAVAKFDQTLAAAGSSLWRSDTVDRAKVIDRAASQSVRETARVTVTGPTFVALSSTSGRFPVTVTNNLTVPVTVQVVVHAANPAVHVDPIAKLALDPGQHRDIEATARTDGSGVTAVRIRLTTTSHHPIGQAWHFDIRSTQIGVAIWVVMGIGLTILFGAAALRIYRRIRGGGLQTRAEASP